MKHNNNPQNEEIAIHIFIIWSNACNQKKRIITDIKQNFDIIKIFNIHWDPKNFLKNLIIFYSHSQQHLSQSSIRSLMEYKMKHCGNGDFHVIVFKDKTPIYENRETSNGEAFVNVRVFDKKQQYRQWSGGGHKIHCSNDAWETNKDLTILFGLNTNDFCQQYGTESNEKSLTEEKISNNCIGVNGYKDIKQFFYVLNNTSNYVVLRNHECLPEQYTVEGHGDIDLLVENKNYIKYLTLAEDVYNLSYRVYHTINIAGRNIPFDFRHLGDRYYDTKWEYDILKKRKLLPKGIFVPDEENQFFSLLYHAYVQKRQVADDYISKLNNYATKISLKYSPIAKDAMRLLDSFIKKNNYEYIKPIDETVYFNPDNLRLSEYAFRHGKIVSYNYQGNSAKIPFISIVYKNDNTYYKRGSTFLVENEVFMLQDLKNYPCFPKLIDSGTGKDGAYLVTSSIEGENFQTFFSSKKHLKPTFIRSFIKETIKILKILTEKRIIHRDFIGQNILIQETNNGCKVYLIDFGWAVKKNEYNKCLHPNHLGSHYAPSKGASDFYTLAMNLKELWPKIKFVNNICNLLQANIFNGEDDTDICLETITKIEKLLIMRFPITDKCRLFAYSNRYLSFLRRKALLIYKRHY